MKYFNELENPKNARRIFTMKKVIFRTDVERKLFSQNEKHTR